MTNRTCMSCGVRLKLVGKTTTHPAFWAHDATIGDALRAAVRAGVPAVHPVLRAFRAARTVEGLSDEALGSLFGFRPPVRGGGRPPPDSEEEQVG